MKKATIWVNVLSLIAGKPISFRTYRTISEEEFDLLYKAMFIKPIYDKWQFFSEKQQQLLSEKLAGNISSYIRNSEHRGYIKPLICKSEIFAIAVLEKVKDFYAIPGNFGLYQYIVMPLIFEYRTMLEHMIDKNELPAYWKEHILYVTTFKATPKPKFRGLLIEC